MGQDLTELAEEMRSFVSQVHLGLSTTRPRRRRRKMFAAAELLESRALLSAVRITFDRFGPLEIDVAINDVPLVPVLVDTPYFGRSSDVDQFSGETAQKSSDLSDGDSSFVFDSIPGFAFGGAFPAESGQAANGLASVSNNAVRVSSGLSFSGDTDGASELDDSAEGGHVVELKLAGSGQVVAYGAARSLQDDSGITVGDSDGPTTYVRSTDAEGRSVMRLVFVQRAPRAVAVHTDGTSAISEGVVVDEADMDSTTLSEEFAERADLNDLSMVLESSRHESVLIADSERDGSGTQSLQVIAKGTTVRAPTAKRADRSSSAEVSDAVGVRNSLTESAADDDGVVLEASELAAAMFHPQPKYLILALCIIGSLVRPLSRIRRLPIIRRLRRLGV